MGRGGGDGDELQLGECLDRERWGQQSRPRGVTEPPAAFFTGGLPCATAQKLLDWFERSNATAQASLAPRTHPAFSCGHRPATPTQVTVVVCCSALLALVLSMFLLRSRPVYLVDYSIFRAPDRCVSIGERAGGGVESAGSMALCAAVCSKASNATTTTSSLEMKSTSSEQSRGRGSPHLCLIRGGDAGRRCARARTRAHRPSHPPHTQPPPPPPQKKQLAHQQVGL